MRIVAAACATEARRTSTANSESSRVNRIGGVYFTVLLVFAQALLSAPPEIHVTPQDGVLRFAVAGDVGLQTKTIAAAIAEVAKSERLDFVLLAGDNFYPCGVKSAADPHWSVIAPLTKLGLPIFPLLGNHDVCGNASAQIGTPVRNWDFPAREYAIRGGVADIAMIDTNAYVTGKSRDAEATIREVFATSTARWRIVAGHHTILSSGFHGHYPRAQARRMRELLAPMRASTVNLYICGHDHHEELVGSKPLMLISGAGSDPVPVLRLRSDTVFPRHHALVEHIGFAVVEVSEAAMRIRFYDAHGRPRSDWFTYGP